MITEKFGSLRMAGIPLDYVLAELAAFPFASESSLKLGIISLNEDLSSDTDMLWKDAERYIIGGFPAFSVDEVVAIRDKVWFSELTNRTSLDKYLKSLAQLFLNVRGSVAIPRLPPDEHRNTLNSDAEAALARRGWRWLTLALPSDLLLAALGDRNSGPDRIDLISPALDRHLFDQGFAETHLHLGAALDFSLMWIVATFAISDPVLKPSVFESPGAELNRGKDLAEWLIRAVISRYLLAAYLAIPGLKRGFFDYLFSKVRARVSREMGHNAYITLLHCISDMTAGQLSKQVQIFHHLKGIYAQLTGLRSRRFPDRLEDIQIVDPVASLLIPAGRVHAKPETRFTIEALSYLAIEGRKGVGARDHLFASLFWQCVRVRSLFYRYIVHRPMTPGLQWFVRFYERMRKGRKPMALHSQLESAVSICGARRGLKSLEVRIGPSSSYSGGLQEICELSSMAKFLRADIGNPTPTHVPVKEKNKKSDRLEIGVIVHFIKDRGGKTLQGLPNARWLGSHADPSGSIRTRVSNPNGYRYGSYYVKKRTEALSLAWLLRHFPHAIELVRGLDVCADELGVPGWVLAPLLAHVRKAADDGAEILHQKTGRSVPIFRTTVHSGEDFVHLLTGLRNVDEAITHFRLNEGDRIGHGIALGIDPRIWARQAGRIAMYREERLLDLVWEWSWYGRESGLASRGRLQVLDYEIAVLSAAIFGEVLHPYEIEKLVQDLYNPKMLWLVGFPHWPIWTNIKKGSRLERLYKFLTHDRIFKRGREIIWINPGSEAETLLQLQIEMRRKVGRKGISVEINPTSNLLVGDLGDLSTHPLWRLRPPQKGSEEEPPVSIVIGSDDPILFVSNLREEYQCLCDAMKFAGLSDEEALQWLDKTRACGLESRFTIDSDFSVSPEKEPYFSYFPFCEIP